MYCEMKSKIINTNLGACVSKRSQIENADLSFVMKVNSCYYEKNCVRIKLIL